MSEVSPWGNLNLCARTRTPGNNKLEEKERRRGRGEKNDAHHVCAVGAYYPVSGPALPSAGDGCLPNRAPTESRRLPQPHGVHRRYVYLTSSHATSPRPHSTSGSTFVLCRSISSLKPYRLSTLTTFTTYNIHYLPLRYSVVARWKRSARSIVLHHHRG